MPRKSSPGALGEQINLAPAAVASLAADEALPARQSSRLYELAVGEMQTLK